jgi:beta-galactosidase
VGWEQFALPFKGQAPVRTVAPEDRQEVQLQDDEQGSTLELSAGDVTCRFDKDAGTLSQISLGDETLLHQGPSFNVWRCPTDNDGIRFLGRVEGRAMSWWRDAGLPDARQELVNLDVREAQGPQPPVLEMKHKITTPVHDEAFFCTSRYTLTPEGELQVETFMECKLEVPELPRLGMTLQMQPPYHRLAYFGRGPQENYVDRNAGTPLGLFRGTVADQYVPYIVPQEHGNHTEVRWMGLTREDGRGLKFVARNHMDAGASHFTAHDLFEARHTTDLKPRREVIVNLDVQQTGLGTRSCGPHTFDQYRLYPGSYRFNYTIVPVRG